MENAKLIEEKYTGLLQSAREESADIVKAATQKAQLRSDDIISEAKTEASNVMIRANEEIEREKRRAKKEIRTEISEIAVMVAEKVVGREVTDADQFRLVDEFIDNVGDLV
jgi:F-type H+-transporting ATPase subunit b